MILLEFSYLCYMVFNFSQFQWILVNLMLWLNFHPFSKIWLNFHTLYWFLMVFLNFSHFWDFMNSKKIMNFLFKTHANFSSKNSENSKSSKNMKISKQTSKFLTIQNSKQFSETQKNLSKSHRNSPKVKNIQIHQNWWIFTKQRKPNEK